MRSSAEIDFGRRACPRELPELMDSVTAPTRISVTAFAVWSK